MYEISAILVIIVLIWYAYIFIPSHIDKKTKSLRLEIERLRSDVRAIRKELDFQKTDPAIKQTPSVPNADSMLHSSPLRTPVPQYSEPDAMEDSSIWNDVELENINVRPPQQSSVSSFSSQSKVPSRELPSSERNIGAKLPVWIGSISLILAAVFLVKYSIDAGWLSPAVRVIMGLVFGSTLIATGYKLFEKPSIPNYIRVSQGLVGAGIVALYVGLYAATSIYQFIPPIAGFVGMSLVTVIAIILSVRHGSPIAIFGLVGGMLTPALIHTGTPNPYGLFTYLFMMTGGMTFMMVRRQWWTLAFLPVIGSFIWAIFWIMSGFAAGSENIMAIFAIETMGSILLATSPVLNHTFSEAHERPRSLLNISGLAGTAIIFALIENQLELGLFELAMSGLISAAILVMAWLRPNTYRWAVAGKSILDLAMVSLWIQGEPLTDGLWAVAGLTSLYVLAPEWFIRHSKSFTPWAILQAGGAFAIFLMSYYALPNPDSTFLPTEWGLLALMFALLAISKAAVWRESVHMLTIYAIATLSFLSLGLTILLDADWLPLAFALQSLGVVWIAHKTGLSSLNTVLKLALIVFTISVMGQILLFTNVIIFSFFQTGPEFFAWQIPGNPLLQLGIPLLAYLIASHLAIRSNVIIPFLAKYMALIATGLGAATIYYLVRGAFVDDGMPIFQEPASFWARGCITLVFIIAAELTRILAPRVQTFPLATASSALLHIALFRIVYFDILTLNPFFHDTQNVGSLPLLNAVTMVYGAGLFASLRMVRTHSFYKILSGILLLTLVSLTIRQLFHGEHLDYIDSNMSHTEFYSYSIMWLVTGLGLLTYGVMRNNKSCRIAALGFLLLTIGKVFIFDASVLEGLMRVFSFLGLGVSLIGLSMVYTRFMNTKTDTE